MKSTTKKLCRAGVIAALYTALTYVCLPFAFGPFQIRPAEALCILPLFFIEAIPALTVGCLLSNLASPYLAYDLTAGVLTTFCAAAGTYCIGRLFRGDTRRILLGGAFPVLCNAVVLPLFLVLLSGGVYKSLAVAYWTAAGSIFCSQCIWVYALGAPLYFAIQKWMKR